MELTLIPIAAILLLLSGATLPARVSVQPGATAALMQQIFGNYDAAHDWAVWTPKQVPAEYAGFLEQGRGRTSLAFDTYFHEASQQKRFLVFSTVPDSDREYNCHACGVLLSAFILGDDHGTWTIQTRNLFLTSGGGWGEPPQFSLAWLGQEHVALLVDDGHEGQGVSEGALKLFGGTGDGLRSILGVRSEQDDSEIDVCLRPQPGDDISECRGHFGPWCLTKSARHKTDFRELCTSWHGSLHVLAPEAKTGWSDIVLIQTIIAAAPGAFERKQYRTRFGFADGAYRAIGPPSRGPRLDLDWFRS